MGRIIVIGLGPGSPGDLTLAAWRALQNGQPLYFRTGRHPLARCLSRQGVAIRTFDRLYSQAGCFEQVYRSIARRLISAAGRGKTIYYAVPGHPLVGEATVERLCRLAPRSGIKLKIIPGVSFVEPALTDLKLDLLDGVTVLDALALDGLKEPHRQHLLLAQVYSRAVASRVKLKLMELYPPLFPVTVIQKAGRPGRRIRRLPLYALDRQRYNHYTTLYLPPAKGYSLGDLAGVMALLRSRSGCPWDRQQTHTSLRQYLVEEAYEVIAAIDQKDDTALMEELGDLLLQVVFHSQIAREEERFDLYRVIDTVTAKLIRRHPHVFEKESAATNSQVINRWEQIKQIEKGEEGFCRLAVQDGLPALLRAYKVQKRAAELGFDWPRVEGAVEKLKEELAELEDAYRAGFPGKIEEEFGDLLFAAVNVSRFLKVNPELALGKALQKFFQRFQYILAQAEKGERPVACYSLEQLDRWWEEAKRKGNNAKKQESW
jgi:tetrapyrrole methylase family protein/MazG family protein